MVEGVGLGPAPALDAALASATGAAIGERAPPGDLPAPHGPEVAAPVIQLKDEYAISDDGGA
eukprot:13362057-Alexandrium_andersonii.AAC.1